MSEFKKPSLDSESRVISFSIKPEDIEAHKEVAKLKAHADKLGVSFSFYMIRAIKKLNQELKLNDTGKA